MNWHLGRIGTSNYCYKFFYILILYYDRNLFLNFGSRQIVINMFFRANTFIKNENAKPSAAAAATAAAATAAAIVLLLVTSRANVKVWC